MTDIATIEAAKIERIQDVSEAAHVTRIAKAAEAVYAAQDNHEMAQWAKQIYLRSARKAGELLLGVPRSNGGRNSCELTPVTKYQEMVEAAGVSRFIAHTWQKLAEIDIDKFEEYLIEAKFQGTEYTINGLLSYANGKRDRVYTKESLLKTIEHYVKLYFELFGDDMRTLAMWWGKWMRGDWK